MAQQIIDVGSTANDGQGDPLRTAFIKTNQNFTELYNAGGVSGIANGTSNITIAENSIISMAVDGVPDVVTVSAIGVTVAETMTANTFCAVGNVYSTYYFGNGSSLTGINNINASNLTGTTLSANIVNSSLTNLGVLSVLSVGGNINVAGNIVSNSRLTAANITSNNSLAVGGSATFGAGIAASGQISTTANVVANNVIGNIVTAEFSTVGNVTGANLLSSGQVSVAGNVIGNYFLGNGALLTGIAGAYSNANVAAYLPTYTGALTASTLSLSGSVLSPITTAANITGDYFIGNGSLLTGITATSVGILPTLSVTGNATVGNLSAVGNVSAVVLKGTNLSLSGNVISPLDTTEDITTTGVLTANTANVTGILNMGGNIDMLSQSIVNALSANAVTYYGNGLELTDHAYIGTSTTSGTPAGNVIWSSGNITATANLNANNAVISNNVTAGGLISAGGNIVTAGLISSTGNIIGGNIETAGLISAGGNLSANNVNVTNVVSVIGNVIANNVLTSGVISATGNITANPGSFFVGNLIGNITGCIAVPGLNTEVLYNLTGSVGTSPAFTFDQTSNVLDVGGNISCDQFFIGNGSLLTGITATSVGTLPTLSVTGNATVGNLSAVGNARVGNLSAVGNATASFFIGNGSLLTGVVATIADVPGDLSVSGNTTTGNLFIGGIVSALGNITGQFILGTAGVSTVGNVVANTLFCEKVEAAGNILANTIELEGSIAVGTATGNIIWSSGNVTASEMLNGNNLNISNNATITGNVTGGNILTNGLISAQGNITGNNIFSNGLVSAQGNILTNGLISAQGNITGNNIFSNGLVSAQGNILTSGIVSAQGNITGNNIFSNGLVSAQGNLTAGNVSTGGLMVVASLGSDPTGVAGAIYFNTGNSKFRGFDGTNWTNLN